MLDPMPPSRLRHVVSDEHLARKAARGDDDAFTVLFRRHHPRLVRYCRSILRHDADAEDAAQTAMTKAHAALRRDLPDVAVRPWLFRIAHNEAISLLRRRRPHGELTEVVPDPSSTPEETGEVREELGQVLAGIAELPDRARHALLLRELGGLDYGGIAAVLGTSPGAARQAAFEARAALLDERAGRATSCGEIRRELEACGVRRRPTRTARGHLRGCAACRSWSRAQRARRGRVLIPTAGGLWAWLTGALGLGGGQAKAVAAVAAIVAGITATPAVRHEARRVVGEEAAAKPATTAKAAARTTTARATAAPAPAATVAATTATVPVRAATPRAVARDTATAADDGRAAEHRRARRRDGGPAHGSPRPERPGAGADRGPRPHDEPPSPERVKREHGTVREPLARPARHDVVAEPERPADVQREPAPAAPDPAPRPDADIALQTAPAPDAEPEMTP